MRRNYDVDNRFKVEGNKVHAHLSQDVDPTLSSVKAAKQHDGGNKKEGKWVARIPMVLLYQWGLEDANNQHAYVQGKQNHDPALAAKFAARLNSADFQALRIWEGKIGVSDLVKEANKF